MKRSLSVPSGESRFGWPGDRGLGEKLIREILRGAKTATACPKSFYSASELRRIKRSVGRLLWLVDKRGRRRGIIRQLAVFQTTFGRPDRRLVAGEGYPNAAAFRRAHRHVWDDLFAKSRTSLGPGTVLLAELFKWVDFRGKARR